ncbi:RING finger protein 113A-like protein [Gorgonomyces haynaldii]|nr:RING finger protein 113A-like protein [Gorgonomyces haynaldii]
MTEFIKRKKRPQLKRKHSSDDELVLGVQFKASGTAQTIVENTSTRVLEVDDNTDSRKVEAKDGEYLGLSNYKEYINKRPDKMTVHAAGGIRPGPLKSQGYVRISSRFDYAPDVCKDYKESGYCGFGDSCKFVHDRSDYKTGWQLEQEWDEQQKKKQERVEYFEVQSEHDSDDDLPFACYICRKDFDTPVMTKCGHYFCEHCALEQYSKSQKCKVCGQNTQGVFNVAKNLIAKIEDKKKRMQQKEQEILLKNQQQEEDQEEEV